MYSTKTLCLYRTGGPAALKCCKNFNLTYYCTILFYTCNIIFKRKIYRIMTKELQSSDATNDNITMTTLTHHHAQPGPPCHVTAPMSGTANNITRSHSPHFPNHVPKHRHHPRAAHIVSIEEDISINISWLQGLPSRSPLNSATYMYYILSLYQ